MSDKNNKKSSFIGFRCPDWLKRRLEENAGKEKRSLSNYIYSLLASNVRDHNNTED